MEITSRRSFFSFYVVLFCTSIIYLGIATLLAVVFVDIVRSNDFDPKLAMIPVISLALFVLPVYSIYAYYRNVPQMRSLVSILIFIISQTTYGQFAVVADKDGFANVRSSASIANNIIDKVGNGSIVYCFEPEQEWIPIDYNLDQQHKSGYIHKTRVKFIESLEKMPRTKVTTSGIEFRNESIKLSITTTKFVAKNYTLQYHDSDPSSPSNYIEKINGNTYWGTDGNMPKTQYGSCLLQIGKSNISLPVDNLFEPSLESTAVYTDKTSKKLYITSMNGDAAGAYAVLWLIENGKYKQRFIAVPF